MKQGLPRQPCLVRGDLHNGVRHQRGVKISVRKISLGGNDEEVICGHGRRWRAAMVSTGDGAGPDRLGLVGLGLL